MAYFLSSEAVNSTSWHWCIAYAKNKHFGHDGIVRLLIFQEHMFHRTTEVLLGWSIVKTWLTIISLIDLIKWPGYVATAMHVCIFFPKPKHLWTYESSIKVYIM